MSDDDDVDVTAEIEEVKEIAALLEEKQPAAIITATKSFRLVSCARRARISTMLMLFSKHQ